MKIAFFGTGNFSARILESLLKNYKNVEVSLVVSQPDKPVGRKKILEPTPVKQITETYNTDILQPKKLKKNVEFFSELKKLNLDFIVVVAYGKIIPKEILDIPKYGCINIHGSILPKYRGASPIQESLKNGDTKTGLTIMYMSEGMDEGDILKIEEIEVDNNDKTPDIFGKFESIGPKLLVETLQGVISGEIKGIPQDNAQATYCSKISKEDGKVDFCNEKSSQIYNKYRAYYSWPGIYCYYGEKKLNIEECEILSDPLFLENNQVCIGEVVRINKKNIGIACVDRNILILKEVKLEGKKSMDILSFINGNKDFLNYKFC